MKPVADPKIPVDPAKAIKDAASKETIISTSLEVDENGNPRPRVVNDFEKKWTAEGAVKNAGIKKLFERFDSPVEDTTKNNQGAYFRPSNSMINMDGNNEIGKHTNQVTYIHEYGHYIDQKINTVKTGDKFNYTSTKILSSLDLNKKQLETNTKNWYKTSTGSKSVGPWANRQNRMDVRSNMLEKQVSDSAEKNGVSLHQSRIDVANSARQDLKKDTSIYGDIFRSKDFNFVDDKDISLLHKAASQNDKSYLVDIMNSPKLSSNRARGCMSDLACAMTKNNIGYGHSKSYFKSDRNRGTEAFAQTIVAMNEGDIWLKIAKKIAPSFVDNVENIINETTK